MARACGRAGSSVQQLASSTGDVFREAPELGGALARRIAIQAALINALTDGGEAEIADRQVEVPMCYGVDSQTLTILRDVLFLGGNSQRRPVETSQAWQHVGAVRKTPLSALVRQVRQWMPEGGKLPVQN